MRYPVRSALDHRSARACLRRARAAGLW